MAISNAWMLQVLIATSNAAVSQAKGVETQSRPKDPLAASFVPLVPIAKRPTARRDQRRNQYQPPRPYLSSLVRIEYHITWPL